MPFSRRAGVLRPGRRVGPEPVLSGDRLCVRSQASLQQTVSQQRQQATERADQLLQRLEAAQQQLTRTEGELEQQRRSADRLQTELSAAAGQLSALTETETKLRQQVQTGPHYRPTHRDRDQAQTAGTDRPTLPANSPRQRPNSDSRYRQAYTACQLTETETKLRQQVQTGLHYLPTH